jgi:hypothetical protein
MIQTFYAHLWCSSLYLGDELRIFLAKAGWGLCPVKEGFGLGGLVLVRFGDALRMFFCEGRVGAFSR